jgi:hypothetical protein
MYVYSLYSSRLFSVKFVFFLCPFFFALNNSFLLEGMSYRFSVHISGIVYRNRQIKALPVVYPFYCVRMWLVGILLRMHLSVCLVSVMSSLT